MGPLSSPLFHLVASLPFSLTAIPPPPHRPTTLGIDYGANSQDAEEATEAIVDARRTADRDERTRLYTEALTTILEDRAHLPAYNLSNSFGIDNEVKGFAPHPVSPGFRLVSDFNNVSIGG